jgi:DNA-binding MarR family transcriptional regulator
LVIRSDDITDASGFATAELLADPEVGSFPAQSVRRAIADLEAAGLVHREISGRRVYRIGLTEAGRHAADERRLRPSSNGDGTGFAGVLETQDRRRLLAAVSTIGGRLQEWGASVDVTQPADRLRVELFHLLLAPMAPDPPTGDQMASTMMRAGVLNDALLAAYREDPDGVDPVLIESTVAITVELARLLAAAARTTTRRAGGATAADDGTPGQPSPGAVVMLE